MIILSHRGYWKSLEEKNTEVAFDRSFSLGFGTETDIRDYCGELVISHDIADANCIKLDRFFDIYKSFGNPVPLALNIKADGLQIKLKKLLKKYKIEKYFVFDMSIPDGFLYLKQDLIIFMRQSEHEIQIPFYDIVQGVWLDEFKSHWINRELIYKHINEKKRICIVSPELHGRDYQGEWRDYKAIDKEFHDHGLMICTDFPEDARRFFDETD